MTAKDRREFTAFCKQATDKQIVNIYYKEKEARRPEYAEIAWNEATWRRVI